MPHATAPCEPPSGGRLCTSVNPPVTRRVAADCCSPIVSKALKQRASTVAKATEVFMLLVELDQQAVVVVRGRCVCVWTALVVLVVAPGSGSKDAGSGFWG